MDTILVIDSISRSGGGLLDAERCLHKGLQKLGVKTSVFSLEDSFSVSDLPTWFPLVPKVFPHFGPAVSGAAPLLRKHILNQPAHLLYRAGLWRLPSKYSHEWSRKHRKPEIIAPHGMLDPWAVQNSRWKKRLAHLLFEGSHLRDAACVRTLCQSELDSVRAYGLTNPVCLIPNGIDPPEINAETLNTGREIANSKTIGETANRTGGGKTERLNAESKLLLFLGRLHPKKGLPNALGAWGKAIRKTSNSQILAFSEWKFVVAGWDQAGHEAELNAICRELGIRTATVPAAELVAGHPSLTTEGDTVIFAGPAFGATKDALLRQASAFILPSFSEGLPMSVLEAWSYALPVLMTDHCNLPEGFAAEAAIRISTESDTLPADPKSAPPIADGMRTLFAMTDGDRKSMGARGRALVEDRFTWPKVAAQMKEVYEWVLGGGAKPSCVVC
jgi:poly(glycerol-phosphate) alpha-glucosyltransferase